MPRKRRDAGKPSQHLEAVRDAIQGVTREALLRDDVMRLYVASVEVAYDTKLWSEAGRCLCGRSGVPVFARSGDRVCVVCLHKKATD